MATTVLAGLMVRYGRHWLHSSPSVVLSVVTVSAFMSLVLAGVFACCPDVMRSSPQNYGLLALFTAAESVLVGFACLQYTLGSVVLCFSLTALAVTGLSIYAARTKTDVTGFAPYLLCFTLALVGAGGLLWLLSVLGLAGGAMFGALQVFYAAAGALVFSAYIVYDVQMIMGGNHQHEFSIDDYAMAAICLYMDIIQLFLSILRLLGQKDDGGI